MDPYRFQNGLTISGNVISLGRDFWPAETITQVWIEKARGREKLKPEYNVTGMVPWIVVSAVPLYSSSKP